MFKRLNGCMGMLFLIACLAVWGALGVLIVGHGGIDLAMSGATLSSSGQILAPAPLNSVFQRRALFASVPLPQEVNGKIGAALFNLILSGALVVGIGVAAGVFEAAWQESGGRIWSAAERARLAGLVRLLGGASTWTIRRGILGLPFILSILALYGILFALNEPGGSLIGPMGVQMALALAIAVAVVSLGGDYAVRLATRNGRVRGRYGVRPAGILWALAAAFSSRLFGLTPGIMFGLPGDVRLNAREDGKPQRGIGLALTALTAILTMAAAGWLGIGLLAEAGRQIYPPETLTFFAPIVLFFQTIGFGVWVIGLQTAFYMMLPLGWSPGARLFTWRKPIWALAALFPTFVFVHILLNPRGDLLSALAAPGLWLLIGLIALASLIGFGVWLYARILIPRRVPTNRWYPGDASYQPPPDYIPPPAPPASTRQIAAARRAAAQRPALSPTPSPVVSTAPAPVVKVSVPPTIQPGFVPPPTPTPAAGLKLPPNPPPPVPAGDQGFQVTQPIYPQRIDPGWLSDALNQFPAPTPEEAAEIEAALHAREMPPPPALPGVLTEPGPDELPS